MPCSPDPAGPKDWERERFLLHPKARMMRGLPAGGPSGEPPTPGLAVFFSATTTLRVDAVTTYAYLGLGALEPFFETAIGRDGGVFVVVRSSNPEGRGLQTARLPDGDTVAQHLCREITARNRQAQTTGLGPIGAVVGATCEDAGEMVAALPISFILAPGVGAQGATLQDVLVRMPSARGRVLPNVSRAILAGGTGRAEIGATIAALQKQARALL